MSCQLTDGGPPSVFPLLDEQIARVREMARVFASTTTPSGSRLVSRFGAAMKPDGVPFYLATYAPETAMRDEWLGLFVTEQGPFQINGTLCQGCPQSRRHIGPGDGPAPGNDSG